jgi:hypothetical protein
VEPERLVDVLHQGAWHDTQPRTEPLDGNRADLFGLRSSCSAQRWLSSTAVAPAESWCRLTTARIRAMMK